MLHNGTSSFVRFWGAGVIVLGAACGSESEPGADTDAPACETHWQAEDGVDYGDPWDPPTVPDVADIKFDLPEEDPGAEGAAAAGRFDDLVTIEARENDAWDLDPKHNIYFRRVTYEEIIEHGWDPNDVLIIIPEIVDALSHDAERVYLALPFYPRRGTTADDIPQIHAIDLRYFGDFSVGTVIDRDRRPSHHPTRSRSAFAYFAPADLSSGTHFIADGDIQARLTSDRQQALNVRGVGLDRAFAIRGPIDTVSFTPLLPLDHQVFILSSSYEQVDLHSFSVMHPNAAGVIHDDDDVSQCVDGSDNDGDGVGDHCDYECHLHPDFSGPQGIDVVFPFENSKSFGLFGDLLYCSTAADFWELELATIGFETGYFLNWVDRGESDEINAFRSVVIACDVRDLAEATACHDNGMCLGDLANYPLAGVEYNIHQEDDDMESGYIDFAWPLVDWYVEAGGTAPQIHATVVAAQRSDPPGNFGTVGSSFANLADIDQEEVGAAAVNVVAVLPYLRVAHELGHAMGLPHDTAFYVREDDENQLKLPGFMNNGGGTQPVIGTPDPNESWWGRNAQGVDVYQPKQIWTGSVSGPKWPRTSGFGYSGCEEQTCEYFPNLSCNGTICIGATP